MKEIAIYGARGLGREIACMIKRINKASASPVWDFIGYFDDGIEKGTIIDYGTILGGKNELLSWDREINVAMAIASTTTRNKIVDSVIVNDNVMFPNLIDPNCIFFDENTFNMGQGNLICSGCQFSCCTSLGDFNIFNCFISVGHDTHIGDYNSFMPGTRVSGEIKIGNQNMFGANSFIHQQLKIGDNIVLGACSALIRKSQNGFTYIGIPATKMKI